jgi:hypothetical protein
VSGDAEEKRLNCRGGGVSVIRFRHAVEMRLPLLAAWESWRSPDWHGLSAVEAISVKEKG